MSLFRGLHEVTPLLRMLDDYAVATTKRGFPSTSSARTWQPRFDVREVKDTYELHGELPGIAQENISVQLEDAQTLTISGRTERHYSEGSPSSSEHSRPRQPSVEDAPDDSNKADQTSTEVTKQSSSTEVSDQKHSDGPKYWVAERSVGEFHRSWKFPARLDQDNIKANLKDGILSIVVPKLKAQPPKKISIE